MTTVRVSVSAFYDGTSYEPGADVPCDADFARRTVLLGHAQLLDADGTPLAFEDACQALRIGEEEVAATAAQRVAVHDELNGG